MDSIHSVIDLARLALGLQKAMASVAAENIANANNAQYIAKAVDREAFLSILEERLLANAPSGEETMNALGVDLIREKVDNQVRLDEEVFNISNAELRYQAISKMVSAQFGLLDIAIGAKGK